MIEVTFHSLDTDESSTDSFDGTITELIVDLTSDEWPYDFYSSTDSTLTFIRINTHDLVTFSTK